MNNQRVPTTQQFPANLSLLATPSIRLVCGNIHKRSFLPRSERPTAPTRSPDTRSDNLAAPPDATDRRGTTTKLHHYPGRPRGFAIVVVLCFSFCLLIAFASLSFHHRNVAQHTKISLRGQQAFFAARAAMQHFLLKAKLFPTELYDAVEFAKGKNPYFDFTEFDLRKKDGTPMFAELPGFAGVYTRLLPERELDKNEQPRFFYTPLKDNPNALIRIGSFGHPSFRYLAPNIAPNTDSGRYTQPNNSAYSSFFPDKFLSYFIRDCTNDVVSSRINGTIVMNVIQPALVMNKAAHISTEQTWGISEDVYPYTMRYRVRGVDFKAIQGLRRYNEEAIEILCEGTVFDFQEQTVTQTFNKIQKITRVGSVP